MLWPRIHPDRIRKDFLSAERFMECCTQIWSADRRGKFQLDRSAPSHGSLVYSKRDQSASLFQRLRKSRNRVVLVTSESDFGVDPGELIPPQVAAWYSTNTMHPGVKPLPLGLGNSYCEVTAKAGLLADYAGRKKNSLLYVNFRPETNPVARQPLWEAFGSSDWAGSCTRHAGNVSKEEYACTMASHRFALCPRGNGIDTHRIWEALYLGTIPVLERHQALESFSDLPVCFVDHLGEITRGELESKYEQMIAARWNWEKLFLPWWKERLDEERKLVRDRVSWFEKLGLGFP